MLRHAMTLRSWLALVCLLGACSSDPETRVASTQVLLGIDAEPGLRTQTDALYLALWVEGASGWTRRSEVELRAPQLRWPLDIPLIAQRAEDESARLEVIVEARAAGQRIAQARVVSMFKAGQRGSIFTQLRSCPGREPSFTCAAEECHGSSCLVCSTSGDCVVAGEQPNTPVGDKLDGAVASDGRDASTSAPDARTGGEGGDAASPPTSSDAAVVDDASASTDSGAPDAAMPGSGCPADHGCQAPYACVPTKLGYTCRGQLADWPMPDAMLGAKVAPSYTSDGEVVVDNITGLHWQVGIPSLYAGCTGKDDYTQLGQLCTRLEARKYCDELSWGKHDDWRLPSYIELVSLLDAQRASGAGIDEGNFGDTSRWVFLSDSNYASGPANYWMLNYFVRESYAGNFGQQVRCVRAGKEPPFARPADRYQVDATSDTVTDRATGLVWQRTITASVVSLIAAEKLCPSGFRLPTPNELLSLVDPTRAKPAIDTTAFPNAPSAQFWASPRSRVESSVDFATGGLDSYPETALVRCVR